MTRTRPALLGIDVGTSSAKAVLLPVTDSGGVGPAADVRSARAGLRARRIRPGWSEADPRAWWRAVRRAVRGLEREGLEVVGLGLSTLFPSLVALDARGRPLRDAILYDDRRADAEVAAFERTPAGDPAAMFARVGNRLRAGTISLSGLLWLRAHEPEVLERADVLGHAGTYVGRRLTGRVAMDAPNASLTGLWSAPGLGPATEAAGGGAGATEVPRGTWCEAVCEAAGIDPAALPEVLWPTETLGVLAPAAAEALGLEPGLPVAVGAGDSVCGALAMGLAPSEVGAACGSTDCLMTLEGRPDTSGAALNLAWAEPGTWLVAHPMNTTGAAVDWFVEAFLGRGRRRYDRFFDLAGRAAAGSGGVVFLPYLAGERSPVFDPAARGLFLGLDQGTGLSQMARAVLEGIGFGHRQLLERIRKRTGRPPTEVIAVGGSTRHPVWRQIRADVAGCAYRFGDLSDGSAIGAALTGGAAAGVFASVREAARVGRALLALETVRPTPGAWDALRAGYEVYARLYEAVRPLYARAR